MSRFDEMQRSSHYLTMRDGVRVAIDLYLPEGMPAGGRLPAVLHQTRYWRRIELRVPASWFVDGLEVQGELGRIKRKVVSRGYAWVGVDVRGTGASFGSRSSELSRAQARDALEIADWIVGQPWSNGKLALVGVSYSGLAADLLLARDHPAVKAAVIAFAPFDPYADLLAPGGVRNEHFMREWSRATRMLDRNELPVGSWLARWFVSGVHPVDGDEDRELLEAALREHQANRYLDDLGELEFRDDLPALGASFGSSRSERFVDAARGDTRPPRRSGGPGVPVYVWDGWFDGAYAQAAVKRYRALEHPGKRLLIGPWDHTLQYVEPGEGHGPSQFDVVAELLQFLDIHLLGANTGLADEAPVQYFTTGGGGWRVAETWPPADVAVSRLYFAGDGSLACAPPVDNHVFDTYEVDFAAGSGEQTRWKTLTGTSLTDPYPNRQERDERLRYYTSAPLERDVEITGHPTVTLYVTSSARDGLFIAYLEDVDEDGEVQYVSEGLLRALHREREEVAGSSALSIGGRSFRRVDARPLVPGKVTALTFGILPVSHIFRRGHSIRIALAGADVDHFPNIPAGEQVTLNVHRDARHPSHVVLPFVGTGACPVSASTDVSSRD